MPVSLASATDGSEAAVVVLVINLSHGFQFARHRKSFVSRPSAKVTGGGRDEARYFHITCLRVTYGHSAQL